MAAYFGLSILLLPCAHSWADTIVLISGDTIHGEVVDVGDSVVLFDQADLGLIEIPRERITSLQIDGTGVGDEAQTAVVVPPGGEEPEEGEPNEVTAPLEPEFKRLNALIKKWAEKGWTASVDLTYDNSTGNTNEQFWRVGIRVRRTVERTRLTNTLDYYNKTSEGAVTDNKLSYAIAQDWLNPESRWFYFVQGRFDYDEFESWRQRAAGQGGPGYHLIQGDNVNLDLRPGLGLRKEWGSLNDNVRFEGLLGGDFEWKISGKQTLTLNAAFFPVLTDSDDYRSRVSWDWRYQLQEDMGISLLVGALHEYQSIVDPNKEHRDLRFHLGIHFGF
jgi:hypothetical protein